jgi:16S rRNA processing protein RimM
VSSEDSEAGGLPEWEDLVIVGDTLRAHGVRGEILARGLSADDETLLSLERVYMARGPGRIRALRVDGARRQGRRVLLHFEGVETREEVARLSGQFLLVRKSEAPRLPNDACYLFELVGLRVMDGAGTDLGEIVDVIDAPANDVWVARGPRGEFMIPAVDTIVRKIDRAGRRVVIDPIPGLLPE